MREVTTTPPVQDCAEAVSCQVGRDPAYQNKHTATPDDMPSDNETLDIYFSQKVPVSSHDIALRWMRIITISARDSGRGGSHTKESIVEGFPEDEGR